MVAVLYEITSRLSYIVTVYSHDNISKSQHLNVTINETIILKCKFDGIESRMIRWLRNKTDDINLLVSMCLYITSHHFVQ